MSNRLFQKMINQLKDSIDRIIGIIDADGNIIACSDSYRIGDVYSGNPNSEAAYSDGTVVQNGMSFMPIGTSVPVEFTAFVEGEDDMAKRYVSVLAISLSNIKALYDEKYDKSSFIKNLLLDNVLPSDVYIKSKELHLNDNVERVVYLIRFLGKGEITPYDMIQSIFPDHNLDYVISVGENEVVLVKEFKGEVDNDAIEQIALSIVDTMSSEFYIKVNVAIGSAINSIRDISRSYKEAQTAIEVGKVFDTEKKIISYDTLGISRLIYQLPTTLCEMFMQEVFKNGSLDSLDRETLATIQKFFENNLNISETSRKLFVHRNTLVYRLEKIRKLTGLDLREFEDAITFKVALMVKKYLETKPGRL